MADVFRIPVHQAADPEYVVVRGGACLAFKGLGLLDFDEIPDRLQIKEVFKPRPETRDVYADHYTSFRLAFKKMRPLFKRMNPHQRM